MANAAPQIGETDRTLQKNCNLSKPKSTGINLPRNQCRLRKPELDLTNCWRLSVDKSENQKNPTLLCFTSWALYQVLTVHITEKSPRASCSGEREEPFWIVPKRSVPSKICQQEKVFKPQQKLLEFSQSLRDLGEGKHSPPASSSLPKPSRPSLSLPPWNKGIASSSPLQSFCPTCGKEMRSTCAFHSSKILGTVSLNRFLCVLLVENCLAAWRHPAPGS